MAGRVYWPVVEEVVGELETEVGVVEEVVVEAEDMQFRSSGL